MPEIVYIDFVLNLSKPMYKRPLKANIFPAYGYGGLLLLLIFWYIMWSYNGLRAHWAFFPLWLSYILVVNACTERLKGNCLIRRSFRAWMWLFILSAPVWWIFEWLNYRAQYWEYTDVESFTPFAFNLYATLNFSTVLPAVFGTAELIGALVPENQWQHGLKWGAKSWFRKFFFLSGIAMLLSFYFWPLYGAAFLWMSLFFILDPINFRLGFISLLRETACGHWRTVFVLWMASMVCGFFWEMWNYWAAPKWVYHVPFVDFWHVFEMPLLGYLGYLPFALELYAMYHFFLGLAGKSSRLEFK